MTKLEYWVVKINTSVILSKCNYLCKILYAFKKKSRYFIVVRQEKDVKVANSKIYA